MRPWLQKIVEKPEREVSWLQTLSLLESIGARKIAKTVDWRPRVSLHDGLARTVAAYREARS